MDNFEVKYLNVCKLYTDYDEVMVSAIVIDDCDGDNDNLKNIKEELRSCLEILEPTAINEMHQYLVNNGYSAVGVKIGRVPDYESSVIGVTTIKFDNDDFEADCKLIEIYANDNIALSTAAAMATGILYLLALGYVTDDMNEEVLMMAAAELGLCKL